MKYVKNYNELTNKERSLFETLVEKSIKTFSYKRTTKYDFLMVMTPDPYVIMKEHYSTDLDDCVKFLYNVLKILGIRKKVAADRGYSLNIDTGDKLRSIAWQKNNTKASKLISNHNW